MNSKAVHADSFTFVAYDYYDGEFGCTPWNADCDIAIVAILALRLLWFPWYVEMVV